MFQRYDTTAGRGSASSWVYLFWAGDCFGDYLGNRARIARDMFSADV